MNGNAGAGFETLKDDRKTGDGSDGLVVCNGFSAAASSAQLDR